MHAIDLRRPIHSFAVVSSPMFERQPTALHAKYASTPKPLTILMNASVRDQVALSPPKVSDSTAFAQPRTSRY